MLFLATVGLLGAAVPAQAITLPAGFSDSQVASVTSPTDFAFTPDGRILVTTEWGQLSVIRNGTRTTALDIASRICDNGERGLLGVAVDPSFGIGTNRYIYLYYTLAKASNCPAVDQSTPASSSSPVNRVSRFVLSDSNTVDPASEIVLIDNIVSAGLFHNAGDLEFGPDGNLYASTGDGSCDYRGDSGCNGRNDASRDQNVLNGKVLRIRPDGSIPPDNPFQGADADRCNVTGQTTAGRKCKETYVWGFRNPWRLSFDRDASGTRFFVNDVGQDVWEEIDLAQPGADYGWNLREGPCANNSSTNCGPPPAGVTNPVFAYAHSSGCSAITGGAFVPNGWWPSEYDQSYIYADYTCGTIFKLDPNGSGGFTSSQFATNAGAPVGMAFSPPALDRALYYLNYSYSGGELRRIAYTGAANRSPNAVASATPTSGSTPLAVNFTGSASSDPDGDPLTYQWDFGDGTALSTSANPAHTYTTAGIRTATLTVSDGRGGSDTDTVSIDAGNRPPVPVISSPAASKLFSVGEQITLTGSATDPDEGALADTRLSWQVIKHHNTHTHPFLAPTPGNNLAITGPVPEDLPAAGNSYLEIALTATDSAGLSATVSRNLNPKTVPLTFETAPAGLALTVADTSVTAPATITSWAGWSFPITAFTQPDTNGTPWRFDHWSDAAAGATRTITTPAAAATYRATFEPLYPRPASATPVRLPLVTAYGACTSPNSTHVMPLNLQACNPPKLESSLLTTSPIGRGSGAVKLKALVGNPSTPADEADTAINAWVTDVRRASDGLDYTGKVLLSWRLRVTDSANGSGALDPATTAERTFSIPIQCTATPSANLGGACELNSTLDTLLPGLLGEGQRTILATSAFSVLDPGADGSLAAPGGSTCPPTCGTGDERLFQRQGLFLP